MYPFILDENVKLYGVEAAGRGFDSNEHAMTINKGSLQVLHGTKMYVLNDEDGNVDVAHSISAGLDYPGAGPEQCTFFKSISLHNIYYRKLWI